MKIWRSVLLISAMFYAAAPIEVSAEPPVKSLSPKGMTETICKKRWAKARRAVGLSARSGSTHGTLYLNVHRRQWFAASPGNRRIAILCNRNFLLPTKHMVSSGSFDKTTILDRTTGRILEIYAHK